MLASMAHNVKKYKEKIPPSRDQGKIRRLLNYTEPYRLSISIWENTNHIKPG